MLLQPEAPPLQLAYVSPTGYERITTKQERRGRPVSTETGELQSFVRKGRVMNKQQVNPTSWQEKFGFAQGCSVDDAQRLLFVAGQVAVDDEGRVVGEGDVEVQTRQVFANMRRVLEQAGMSFENVVQLGVYMTDMSQIRVYGKVRDEFVDTAAPPTSTAVGVTSLALPGLLIEVNAVAVS